MCITSVLNRFRFNVEGSSENAIEAVAKPDASEQAIEIANKIASEMGIPTWGLVAIIIGILKYYSTLCFCNRWNLLIY